MLTIAIVDYGAGNLMSVQRQVVQAGAKAVVSGEASVLFEADGVILPGVGAFGAAMTKLRASGLVPVLEAIATEKRIPLLGICLGLQLLCRGSDEDLTVKGLGLIDADCHALDVSGHEDWRGKSLTLPHMGWNSVYQTIDSSLFSDIHDGTDFYFAHSFFLNCDNSGIIAAKVTYGENVCCAVQTGTLYGAQFHPEKSQQAGQKFLRNFVGICDEFRGSVKSMLL